MKKPNKPATPLTFEPNMMAEGIGRGIQAHGRDWVAFVSEEDWPRVNAELMWAMNWLDRRFASVHEAMVAQNIAHAEAMDRMMADSIALINKRAAQKNRQAGVLSIDDNF